jgi:hypothetical protein
VEWWRHNTAVVRDPGEDRKMVLKICLGAVVTTIYDKLGDVYFELKERELLLEVERITSAGPGQPPKPNQLARDTVAVYETEETIDDQQGVTANKGDEQA